MASPSDLAVFRLITNSNWVGWKTGKSAGFHTFEDLSDVGACVSVGICDIGSIADETTIYGIFTKLINCTRDCPP